MVTTSWLAISLCLCGGNWVRHETHTCDSHSMYVMSFSEVFFKIKSIYFWILWSYKYIHFWEWKWMFSGWPKRYFGKNGITSAHPQICSQACALGHNMLIADFSNRLNTVGPLIIESFWGENRVSTGALGALDSSLVVQTKIWKHGWLPVDNT